MIAADTSTWIAFFSGSGGADVDALDDALRDRQVLMAPVVLTELLSDPRLPATVSASLRDVPLIEIADGYWQRAGECLSDSGVEVPDPFTGKDMHAVFESTDEDRATARECLHALGPTP